MSEKKISLSSMVLFALCSIMVLYTLSVTASYGVSGITTWLIVIVLFFIPYALISSELGATWPEDGGIYIWAKRAFGDFIASQVSWLYWINVVFFVPAVCVTFAGNLNSYFFPNMSKYAQMGVVIGLLWFIVVMGITREEFTRKITQYGGYVISVLITIMFIFATIYGIKYGYANDFALKNFKPDFSSLIHFAPVVIFNLLGFELLCSIASKMDNPKKNVPKSIMLSGVLVAVFYILGSVSILSVIPVEKVNSVTAITDSFTIMITGVLGEKFSFIATIMTAAVLYNLLASATAWVMGANNVMMSTGADQGSKILGHAHPKYGTPDYAYYIVGSVGTIYTIFNYMGGSNVQAIFWTIFAFSSILYELPYLAMFLAVIKLRYKEPNTERPYRIPGGKVGLWICGLLAFFGIVAGIILFSLPPVGTENVLKYELTVWGGLAVVIAVGVLINLKTLKKQSKVELEAAIGRIDPLEDKH